MIDRWEHQYGLDVLNHTPLDLDSDGDGLDLFDEYLNGTDPNNNDSDRDGANDQDEVDQGSFPNDSSDGGQPPDPDEMLTVKIIVGDPSGSHSERWQMRIIGLGPDTRTLLLANEEFGTVTPSTQKTLWKNTSYRIELQHLGTNIPAKQGGPDYDWRATVEGEPSTSVLSSGHTHSDASRFSVIQNHWILDNEDGLLGRVNQDFYSTNHATGKVAYLRKVEVEFQNQGMSSFKKVRPSFPPDTRIGVIMGDDVNFKAILPSELDESLISWSGEKNGNGETITITFKTLGNLTVTTEYAGNDIVDTTITVDDATGVGETMWGLLHPIRALSAVALRDEALAYAANNEASLGGGSRNGRADAARHAYWNGIMTIDWDAADAEGLATAHEVTGLGNNSPHNETVMDLENNAIGRGLVTSATMTRAQLDNAVRAALNSGELTILDEVGLNGAWKGLLKPSNL